MIIYVRFSDWWLYICDTYNVDSFWKITNRYKHVKFVKSSAFSGFVFFIDVQIQINPI